MKQLVLIVMLLSPMCVFSQTHIAISDVFDSLEQNEILWYVNGQLLHYDDFPVSVYSKNDGIDSIVFVHSISKLIIRDTLLTKFHKDSQLLLIPDNNGSFDVIHVNAKAQEKNRIKFIISNCNSDTIICSSYRVATSTGHIFVGSGISGWMKAWKNPYSSNTIQISVYESNGVEFQHLNKKESVLFGDKHCSIVEWDMSQHHALKLLASLKLRLFGHDKAYVIYDYVTGLVSIRINKYRTEK